MWDLIRAVTGFIWLFIAAFLAFCIVGAIIGGIRSIPLLFQGSIEELLPRWTLAIIVLLFLGVPAFAYINEKWLRWGLDNSDARIASTPTPESAAHPTEARSHTADTPTENTPTQGPPSR